MIQLSTPPAMSEKFRGRWLKFPKVFPPGEWNFGQQCLDCTSYDRVLIISTPETRKEEGHPLATCAAMYGLRGFHGPPQLLGPSKPSIYDGPAANFSGGSGLQTFQFTMDPPPISMAARATAPAPAGTRLGVRNRTVARHIEFTTADQKMHVVIDHHSSPLGFLDFNVTFYGAQLVRHWSVEDGEHGLGDDADGLGAFDAFACQADGPYRHWINMKSSGWVNSGVKLTLPPPSTIEHSLSESTRNLASCGFSGGVGRLTFRRPLGIEQDAQSQQREIKLGEVTHFTWAHGTSNSIGYHGHENRGNEDVIIPNVAASGCSALAPSPGEASTPASAPPQPTTPSPHAPPQPTMPSPTPPHSGGGSSEIEFSSGDNKIHVVTEYHNGDGASAAGAPYLEFTVTLEQDRGWFAVGVSKDGHMLSPGSSGGSDVFACESGGTVTRYWLNSRSSAWVSTGQRVQENAQNSCQFSGGRGVLKFRRFLGVEKGKETSQRGIRLGAESHFIWAHGTSNRIGYHGSEHRGSVSSVVQASASASSTPSPSIGGARVALRSSIVVAGVEASDFDDGGGRWPPSPAKAEALRIEAWHVRIEV